MAESIVYTQRKKKSIFIYVFMLFSLSSVISLLPDEAAFRDVALPFFLMIVLAMFHGSLKYPKHSFLYYILWLEGLFSTLISSYIGFESTAVTYLFFCMIVLLVGALSNLLSENDVTKFTKFYIIVGCVCSLLIILSWIKGIEHGWGRYSIDVIGVAKNPNYINEVILLAFAFLMLRFVNKSGNRLVQLSLMAIMVTGVLLTGTRAALITMLLIVMIITGRYVLKGKSFSLLIGVSLLALVVLYVFINYLSAPILMRLSGEEIFSDDLREYMWTKAFAEYKKGDLFFGMGINGTTAYISTLNLPTICIHNVILQFLCDQGILGVLLFVIIVASMYFQVKKCDRFNFILFLITLYLPMFFQNGTVTFTFWWPLAFFEFYTCCSKLGILNGIIKT